MDYLEEILEINPEALKLDGFDEAIIGFGDRINMNPVLIYDEDKIIEILINEMDIEDEHMELMSEDEILAEKYSMAIEHFDYNIKGSWMGENTPIIMKVTNKNYLKN